VTKRRQDVALQKSDTQNIVNPGQRQWFSRDVTSTLMGQATSYLTYVDIYMYRWYAMKKNYLSYTMALTLQAIENGYGYGFDIMTVTGLASGTVYPALRRLEDAEFVSSKWEKASVAQAELRPPRKYYEVTKAGRTVLAEARQRFRLLSQLEPLATNKPARQKS
jgi:DNA-binding MarR family transcriptional regulator